MSIPDTLGLATVDIAGHTLCLRRAWPRGGRRMLLEYTDCHGEIWAGQWFGDEAERGLLHRRHRHTSEAHPEKIVEIVDPLNLLAQQGGADRKLIGLATVAGRGTNRLMAHRAERRAVVRLGDGSGYVKFVDPGKVPSVMHAGKLASGLGALSAPRLLAAGPERGSTCWQALPGRTLQELGETAPLQAWGDLGRQLRHLHDTPAPAGLPVHGWRQEADVLNTWFSRYAAFSPSQADTVSNALAHALAGLEDDTAAHGLIHRDLHDKQVLRDEAGDLHWLDFDTLSTGEPALDLANLLVHLHLRSAQGSLAPEWAAEASESVLDAYRPATTVRRRVMAYVTTTALRLHFLYAFRSASLPANWLEAVGATSFRRE